MKKKIIYSGVAIAAIVIVIMALRPKSEAKAGMVLNTGKVARADISEIITATGTLEAIETVEVGTQVSGIVDELFVDFNTQVKRGQLLAKLDQTPLLATLKQSQSQVDNAQAELTYQKSTFERTKVLFEKQLIAQSDYDLALYNYQKAEASLMSAKCSHDKNKINLGYATIFSPIDGVILDRAVEEGQTVAASFNTPTLFTIVNDLTQMQVEADIDEADIGKVREGQRVEFTVDAYPDRKFTGIVTQIRLQPVETSNVVTYTVIVKAPNPDKELMPGMTANVSFYVMEKKNIVVIPAKAVNLIATPDNWLSLQALKPELQIEMPKPPHIGNGEMPSGTPPMGMENAENRPSVPGPDQNKGENNAMKIVWVKSGDSIKPRMVEVGETDEINYEVITGINEGEEVITSLQSNSGAIKVENERASSPFMPKPPGQNRKK